MKSTDHDFINGAGRLISKHAMYWVRLLEAPVEQVWPVVSTKEGLETWWLVPADAFNLRVGGVFKHHGENAFTDYIEQEYIDFDEKQGTFRGTGGMRFELGATNSK